MKKKHLFLLLTGILILLLGGCNKYSADKYVGEQITLIKEEDASALMPLLEDGIVEENEKYVLQFPEELKKPYLDFLQEALKAVQFELDGAKKADDESYTVQITFTPLDVGQTTQDMCEKYLPSISSSDLTGEVTSLLTKAAKTISSSPAYQSETFITLRVKKNGDSYKIEDEDMKDFLSRTLINIMVPYDRVCEILDMQNYLTSTLDAIFKGDVTQYAKHSDQTEEEALAEINEAFLSYPDWLLPTYQDRFSAAVKTIFSQCQYSVGIPQKESGMFNYIFEVTLTPNTSFINAVHEYESGTYYSDDAVSRGLVEALEKYAAAPTYGEEVTMKVTINSNTLASAGEEGAELTNLIQAILPTE